MSAHPLPTPPANRSNKGPGETRSSPNAAQAPGTPAWPERSARSGSGGERDTHQAHDPSGKS